MPPRIGGSFAPPIEGNLEGYRELAAKAAPAVGEAMQVLCDMVEEFNKTPASQLPAFPDRTGRALMIPLESAEIARMDSYIPWKHELDMYATLFDGIDARTDKETRDAAFHLLWYGYEFWADREPMTSDKLRS